VRLRDQLEQAELIVLAIHRLTAQAPRIVILVRTRVYLAFAGELGLQNFDPYTTSFTIGNVTIVNEGP
jgi:hypothetical protein